MRASWITVAMAMVTGCGARVDVERTEVRIGVSIVDDSPGLGGGGAGGTGGGGAGPGCAFASECDPTSDKKLQKLDCDDGEPQTVDRCVAVADLGGVCAHTEAECDVFDPMPVQAKACDDGDPGTTDRCTKWNACLSLSSGAHAAGARRLME